MTLILQLSLSSYGKSITHCISSDVLKLAPGLKDFLSSFFQKLSLESRINSLPDARIISSYKNGECDTLFLKGAEVQDVITENIHRIDVPLFNDDIIYGLYKIKGTKSVALKDATIIYKRGSIPAQKLLKKIGAKSHFPAVDLKVSYKLLKKGRGHYLIASKTSVNIIKNLEVFEFDQRYTLKSNLYLFVNDNYSKYKDVLEEKLNDEIKNGNFNLVDFFIQK